MATPSIPDPAAAAQRVRGIARDLAADVSEGYRKSNKYLRMRAAIVGTWVLLAIVALYTACPGTGPSNELAADVTLLPETLVGQQLSVSNGSSEMWTEVTLTLDGAWKHKIRTVRAGQNVVVAVSRFERGGAPAPADLKPQKVEIDCDQGSAELSLARR
ncbi:MAG TPA: hypothetical protein VLT47_04140 [Anaeromyxobacteraceae bacterium]|nr:hypothetical protein [Anaeromyxobacteraceae bacterium]